MSLLELIRKNLATTPVSSATRAVKLSEEAQIPPEPRRRRAQVQLQEERYIRKVTQQSLASAVTTVDLPVTAEMVRLLEMGRTVEQQDETLRRIAVHFGMPERNARGLLRSTYVPSRSYGSSSGLLDEIRKQVDAMPRLTPEQLKEALAGIQARNEARKAQKKELARLWAKLRRQAVREANQGQLKLKL